MRRYIDADKLQKDGWKLRREKQRLLTSTYETMELDCVPTADVRKNVIAKKVIGGGEHDGATCWFECSHCHGTVDIEDAYCKHCGAVLEIGERKDG